MSKKAMRQRTHGKTAAAIHKKNFTASGHILPHAVYGMRSGYKEGPKGKQAQGETKHTTKIFEFSVK